MENRPNAVRLSKREWHLDANPFGIGFIRLNGEGSCNTLPLLLPSHPYVLLGAISAELSLAACRLYETGER